MSVKYIMIYGIHEIWWEDALTLDEDVDVLLERLIIKEFSSYFRFKSLSLRQCFWMKILRTCYKLFAEENDTNIRWRHVRCLTGQRGPIAYTQVEMAWGCFASKPGSC